MVARKCPTCQATDSFETNDSSGDTVCIHCGTVLEESHIVSSVEFVETAAGTSSVIGQFISGTATKPYGAAGPGYGLSRESREVAIEGGRRQIQQLAAQLSMSAHFVDAAHRLYILALHHHFTQGRRSSHVVAACLYIVCRRERSPHLLIDFSESLNANLYSLGACFLKFSRLLALDMPVIDPSLYIHRFAARMDLGDMTHAVAMTAIRLVARMKRDWIQTGRRPAGICGACLLIGARMHGFRRTRAEVMQVVRVTDLTLRNRLAEFGNTQASQLPLDEFDRLEASAEADPPAYVRGVLEDELAKETALIEDAIAADLDDGSPDGPLNAAPDAGSTTALALPDVGAPVRTSAGNISARAAVAVLDRPELAGVLARSHLITVGEGDGAGAGASSGVPRRTGLSEDETKLWKARMLLNQNWGGAVQSFQIAMGHRARAEDARIEKAVHDGIEPVPVPLPPVDRAHGGDVLSPEQMASFFKSVGGAARKGAVERAVGGWRH